MDKFDQYQPGRKGVDILAAIMQHCNPSTNRNIMGGLSKTLPRVVDELKQTIRTFEDLAYADTRGMQKLLKLVSTKDLALALRGTAHEVIQNIALNMSKNKFADLKNEIAMNKTVSQNDIFAARDQIMTVVMELIEMNELYINRPGSRLRN